MICPECNNKEETFLVRREVVMEFKVANESGNVEAFDSEVVTFGKIHFVRCLKCNHQSDDPSTFGYKG